MKTKTISAWLLAASLAGLLPGACLAQTPSAARPAPAPRAAPRPDDINPGVDTSADIHPRDNTPGSSAVQASQAAEESAAAAPAPSGKAGQAGRGSKAGKPDKAGGKPDAAQGKGKAQDHLDLDRTQITGNRELPKVMVIVPWKRSDLGDLGKPMNSLVNEVLQPIDRDVFQRQTRYYDALKPDAAGNAAPAAAPAAPGSGR